ncbi:MAG: ABC transporter permease [Bdellovibrionaceae bacterium]|nr:ABC transporter permease [Pseudobdellovibrionaceae bacterium]
MNFVDTIGEKIRSLITKIGEIFLFGYQSITLTFATPYRYHEILRHMEFVGNQSVGIITLTSIFTGLALSFQVYLGFKLVNAVNLVGPTVALGITRELGPVLTGLIVSARAGGAMAARLGTMRVNEQMDALDVMGVNIKQYLIAPRIVAAALCMPLLTALFDFMAMFGSWILCTKIVGLDQAVFFEKIRQTVEVHHINEGLFKSFIFGIMFAVICTYHGFNTTGGAKGVGEATNKGVVISMVGIIIVDYFLMNIIRILYVTMGIVK